MSFKRDLVIKNQFSVKRGGVGTKGNTPGQFVLRYMARDNATELLTPVTRYSVDNFITRYMARDNATEIAQDLPELHHDFKKAQGLGGRSFGKGGNQELGDASLSDQDIRRISKRIQKGFDQGKTVLESVISFDGHYLQDHGLGDKDVKLDSNGHAYKKGAWRGKIDQMKLRLAIMNGLEKMARHKTNGHKRFEDFAYVGVIQVDTKQVHCHLAMTDLGNGTLTKDGEQRGIMTKKDMENLRRGIDNAVNTYLPVKSLSVKIMREKQDTRSYIKKFTEKAMEKSSFSQILLASLPENKRLWRANTHSKEMRRANQIMRFYVENVLQQPKSGYKKSLRYVEEYALARQKRENLSNHDFQTLVKNGRKKIIDSCMDSVYGLLKDLPQTRLTVHTKMLDNLSADIDSLRMRQNLKPRDPAAEFSFHLRSYTSRLKKHRAEGEKYDRARQDYLHKQAIGQTSKASRVVFDFYNLEEDYHDKLACKYQQMIPLIGRSQAWKKQLEIVRRRRRVMLRLAKMMQDARFETMNAKEAEQYGIDKYGLRGGRFNIASSSIGKTRFKQARQDYQTELHKLERSLMQDNKSLHFDKNDEIVIDKKPRYGFDDVKALDVHDVGDDFEDSSINQKNINQFVRIARQRRDAYENVVRYAINSNQPEILLGIDGRDIRLMNQVADSLNVTPVLPKRKTDGNTNRKIKHKKVVSLDDNLTDDIRKEVINTVKSVNSDWEYNFNK